MRGATLHATRERRVGVWTAGLMLAVMALAVMWQGPTPADDGWKHLYGQTYTRLHKGMVEYRYDDMGMVCRYKPAEWDRPKCQGVGDEH